MEVIPFDTDYFVFQEGGSASSGYIQAVLGGKEDYLSQLSKEQLNILGERLNVAKRSVRPDLGRKYIRKNHSALAIKEYANKTFEKPTIQLNDIIKDLFPEVVPITLENERIMLSKEKPQVSSPSILYKTPQTPLIRKTQGEYQKKKLNPNYQGFPDLKSSPTTTGVDLNINDIFSIAGIIQPNWSIPKGDEQDNPFLFATRLLENPDIFGLNETTANKIARQYFEVKFAQSVPKALKLNKNEKKDIREAVKRLIMNLPPNKSRSIREYILSKKYTMFENPLDRITPPTEREQQEQLPRVSGRERIRRLLQPRGRGVPPEKAFFDGAVASYEKKAPNFISGFRLIMDTPTFDAYLRDSDKTILLTSRGTEISSWNDLKSDASLIANNLKNTNRYNQDANLLRQLITRFPSPPYEYSIAGHSLGVAIANQLMRDFPFIKMAVGYNGAFQPADIQQQNPNIKRLYTDKDFLYNLGGRLFRNVRLVPMDEEASKSFFGRIASFFTPSGLKAHSLSNFKKVYGSGIPKGLNRLATPEEIAKGEYYDYKGRKWYKPLSAEDIAKEKERITDVREQMRVEKIAEYYRQFGGIQGFQNKTMGRQLGSMVATINATGESNPELYGATIKSLVQYFTEFAYLIQDDSVPPATNINDFYLAFSNINNEALQEKLLSILEQFYQDGYVGTFWLEKRAKREAERQKAFEQWRQQHPFEAFVNGVGIGLKSFIESAFLRPISNITASILNAIPLPPSLGFLREGANAVRNQFQQEAIRNERLSGVADPTTMGVVQTGADILNPLSGLSQGLQVGEALSGLLPEQTGQGKNIKDIVRKMVDRKKLIDFGTIRWGTLTELYNRYKKKHPQTSAKSLGEFAHMILNNPERFSKKATKKARFYVNIIESKSKRGKGNGDDDDEKPERGKRERESGEEESAPKREKEPETAEASASTTSPQAPPPPPPPPQPPQPEPERTPMPEMIADRIGNVLTAIAQQQAELAFITEQLDIQRRSPDTILIPFFTLKDQLSRIRADFIRFLGNNGYTRVIDTPFIDFIDNFATDFSRRHEQDIEAEYNIEDLGFGFDDDRNQWSVMNPERYEYFLSAFLNRNEQIENYINNLKRRWGRQGGGKRNFKSKKAGFIASVMTCKNPPARPKFDISKMSEVNEGTRLTNERIRSGDYQWDCVEPVEDLEGRWIEYLANLPTARARATARQRLRYYSAGVEREPVSREEALRRAMRM